ncbi:iron-containing alcohol dehydrogenase [Emcibacter sp. SYSU 3D8]|uniref:iron-containing alcohol dehydrogenase n=1 Tax=Emcibacter sp. SYSU 3D8 TaxID=3133969 RepID=UPI0031FED85F
MSDSLTGNWNYPTRILHGPGRIKELVQACRTLGIDRPLFVTDKGLLPSPIAQAALEDLRRQGIETAAFCDIKPNPVGANIDNGVSAYRQGGHDGVIAFGGGSALDAGKAIAFMSGQTRPIWDFEDIADWWTRADPDGIAPIVAVPTTAGTGSEVGRAAVVLNEDLHEKKIIFHPKMLPAIVLSDPELTVKLPAHITAATGMDAFTHCFEAFCAPGFHPMADGIALEGMRLIVEHLPRAVEDGGNILARSRMLTAASMGAAAFQKGLGAVHAISHPVGALYDTHHGLTNAVVLPYVMMHNRPAIEGKMGHLAAVLAHSHPGFDSVMAQVLYLRDRIGIPHTLAEIGVDARRAAEIGRFAEADPSAGGNPIAVTASVLEGIFRAAVSGRIEDAAQLH